MDRRQLFALILAGSVVAVLPKTKKKKIVVEGLDENYNEVRCVFRGPDEWFGDTYSKDEMHL